MFGYIYRFTIIPTGQVYVGKREKSHFDNGYYGSGKNWKPLLEKWGKENVNGEVLFWANSREELKEKEIGLVAENKIIYGELLVNIHRGGNGGNMVGNTELWSEMHRGEKNGRYHMEVKQSTRDKIGNGNRGKRYSAEVNKKKGRPGVKKPDGFGEKISKSNKGREYTWSRKKVICVENNLIYNSVDEAARSVDAFPQNLGRACRKNKTCRGFHWRYYVGE